MLTKEETKFKETEIGLIPEEWKLETLNNFIKVKHGYAFKSKFFSDIENENILLTPGNFKIGGGFNDNKYKFYAGDIPEDYVLSPFDLIITMTDLSPDGATLGYPALVPNDKKVYLHNQRLGLAKIQTKTMEKSFLYWWLRGDIYRNQILGTATGTTVRHTSPGRIESTFIVLPPPPEQKSIAEILSSLDEKIELNRRMNKTLEEMGKALFKRWFVDFEFPNEDGKPYKSSGGKMVDSELGEIPEGWVLGTLEDIADVSIGRTPPRKESIWFTENPRDIKWISIKDLGNSGVFVTSSSEYLTSEAVKKFKIPVIPNNTIVISFKLTVGRVAITVGEMLSNEAIAHVKLQSKYSRYNYFLYHYLKSFDYSSLGSTSSIATAVNSQSIKQLSCLVPEPLVIQKFNNLHAEHFELILSNTLQIENLISLRENLLPKLISGRIRTI